jgi:hypothetical protein
LPPRRTIVIRGFGSVEQAITIREMRIDRADDRHS